MMLVSFTQRASRLVSLSRPRARAIFGFALVGVACASSQGAVPVVQHPSAIATPVPAVRPIPSDILELAVGAPESVVTAHVDQLRDSPVFARARPYFERATCTSGSELDALLQATTRALAVGYPPADTGERWLLVLEGHYTQDTGRQLLTQVASRRDAATASAAGAPQPIGRFTWIEQAGLSSSVLEEKVLLLGTNAEVRAAIEAVEQPSASFAAAPLFRELGPEVHCAERSACLFIAANGVAARRMQQGLAEFGAKAVGRALAGADSVLSFAGPAGVELSFVARMDTAENAQAVAGELKNLLWKANLLTRLAGLPSVLADAQLRADAQLMRAALNVSGADLNAYLDRAARLFEDAAPGCGAVAVAQ